jgi:hypothetical protein
MGWQKFSHSPVGHSTHHSLCRTHGPLRLTSRIGVFRVRRKMKPVTCSFFLVLAGLLPACRSNTPAYANYLTGMGGAGPRTASGNGHPAPAIPDDVSYWDGDSAVGSPLIKISRTQQKAFFYKGGVLVGISRISSGKEDHGTPSGSYKICEKDKDHKSSAYGVFKDKTTGMTVNDNVDIRVDKIPPNAIYYPAPMLNFMRVTGGVGMHTGYLPGYAASHGCIRMPHHMSEHFFENVKVGTPVIIE